MDQKDILEIIGEFKSSKATGLDDIPNIVIGDDNKVFGMYLMRLLNLSIMGRKLQTNGG